MTWCAIVLCDYFLSVREEKKITVNAFSDRGTRVDAFSFANDEFHFCFSITFLSLMHIKKNSHISVSLFMFGNFFFKFSEKSFHETTKKLDVFFVESWSIAKLGRTGIRRWTRRSSRERARTCRRDCPPATPVPTKDGLKRREYNQNLIMHVPCNGNPIENGPNLSLNIEGSII